MDTLVFKQTTALSFYEKIEDIFISLRNRKYYSGKAKQGPINENDIGCRFLPTKWNPCLIFAAWEYEGGALPCPHTSQGSTPWGQNGSPLLSPIMSCLSN